MNISATNCTPIRPKASFGNNSENEYKKVLETTDELNDKFVNSQNVKKPIAAIASIALAGVIAFASGKRIANIVQVAFKKSPEVLQTGLKKGAAAVEAFAGKLQSVDPEKKLIKEGSKLADKKLGTMLNKISIGAIANKVGAAVEKTEGVARKAYDKVAYMGLKEGGDKAAKAMENLFGIGAVATIVPGVLKRDANDDGVADILQRGQNAYTGSQTKFAGAIDKANTFAEIVDSLT